jgi:hypothetical protein
MSPERLRVDYWLRLFTLLPPTRVPNDPQSSVRPNVLLRQLLDWRPFDFVQPRLNFPCERAEVGLSDRRRVADFIQFHAKRRNETPVQDRSNVLFETHDSQ